MIISASRRTDIPAFYTPWFMERIRQGFLLTRNPFNANQVSRISLRPEDVEAIVFWTRNPEKIIEHFHELNDRGFNYYFQYTITGYPRSLEKSVPSPHKAIETFKLLSDRIGSGRVIWRYDPILASNLVEIDEHIRLFTKIASLLQGKTKRVVVSFADLYKKTERNLNIIEGLRFRDVLQDRNVAFELARELAEIAKQNGMEIQSCAEAVELSSVGIEHGKCIDDDLLKREFGLLLPGAKDKGQREECGCIKSVDIGQYNTCAHGCAYCYATFNQTAVAKNKKLHDANSPFLIGGTEKYLHPEPEIEQKSLF
jgi:DNA repair photolyase